MEPEKQDAVLLLQRAALRFIFTFVSSERSPRKRRTSSSDPSVPNGALQWWDARSRARQTSVLLLDAKRPILHKPTFRTVLKLHSRAPGARHTELTELNCILVELTELPNA